MAVGHIYIAGYKVAGSVAPQPHLTSWYLDISKTTLSEVSVSSIVSLSGK
jgi:hypothetical protein